MAAHDAGTILCLADQVKGQAFLQQIKHEGYRVILLTRDEIAGGDWPRESIDEIHSIYDFNQSRTLLDFVIRLARERRIDKVVGLDEYDTTRAAEIRELFLLGGMPLSTTFRFRDKLAMRHLALGAGIPVPDFVGFENRAAVHQFLQKCPGPWLVKPRTLAGSLGIRQYARADEVRGVFDHLGGESVDFLLEKFIEGDLYHVDGIVDGGRIHFAQAHRYGRPLLRVAHEGGVFTSFTVDRTSQKAKSVLAAHTAVVAALGLERGVTHAEFIEDSRGRFVFVEIACRVGGAHLSDLIEKTCGLNLWREWARLMALGEGEHYVLPPVREEHGGLALCLARQATPDLSTFTDPEIAMKIQRKHHAGIIVTTRTTERAHDLIQGYQDRFTKEFLAVLPAAETGVGNEGPKIRGLIRH
jgi:hypothetical protein